MSGHEMRDTVARALCRKDCDEPCKFCTIEAGIAVVALAEAGYLQTGDGAGSLAESPSHKGAQAGSIPASDTAPSSPDPDGAHNVLCRSTHDALCPIREIHGKCQVPDPLPFFSDITAKILTDLTKAGYSITKTGDGAVVPGGGSPPSAGAVSTAPPPPNATGRYCGAPIGEKSRCGNNAPCAAHSGRERWLTWDDLDHAVAADQSQAFYRVAPETGGGAGDTPPAASAVPHPAAQAGEAIGTPTPPPPNIRRFYLYRHFDHSDVSGVGIVAWGVLWPDNTVSLRWGGEHPSTVAWDNVDSIIRVHGHQGSTEIRWLDREFTAPEGVSA